MLVVIFVQIHRNNGMWYSAEYSTFSISDEVGQYQLTVDGYSGDAGNALMNAQMLHWNANGMKFSTIDRDNDMFIGVHCAAHIEFHGGWWYNQCGTSVVNRDDAGFWKTVGDIKDLQASRMLVKLN